MRSKLTKERCSPLNSEISSSVLMVDPGCVGSLLSNTAFSSSAVDKGMTFAVVGGGNVKLLMKVYPGAVMTLI